jgi:hypothetical protein
MANKGNLKSFKKGETGNPNGRPKKLPELDKLLTDVLNEDRKGITAAESILKALVEKAIKGDIRAAELVLNRAYGKPKEHIQEQQKIHNIINLGDGLPPTPIITIIKPNDAPPLADCESKVVM